MEFEPFDYRAAIGEVRGDSFSYRDFVTRSSQVNFDIGISGRMAAGTRWGVVARNLISRDYATIRGNLIELRPQVRFGFAWERNRLSVAADLDLTRNDPLGFDPDQRFLGAGAEKSWSR